MFTLISIFFIFPLTRIDKIAQMFLPPSPDLNVKVVLDLRKFLLASPCHHRGLSSTTNGS